MNILIHVICVYILINFCCIIFWHTEREREREIERETLIYLVFLCLVMCDFICCFFLRSLPLEIIFYVSQISRPPAKIDGTFWEIDHFCGWFSGVFLFVSDDTAHHQRKCFSCFVKIATAKGDMVVLVESLFWAVVENLTWHCEKNVTA